MEIELNWVDEIHVLGSVSQGESSPDMLASLLTSYRNIAWLV